MQELLGLDSRNDNQRAALSGVLAPDGPRLQLLQGPPGECGLNVGNHQVPEAAKISDTELLVIGYYGKGPKQLPDGGAKSANLKNQD
jgi:hypothetical protein